GGDPGGAASAMENQEPGLARGAARDAGGRRSGHLVVAVAGIGHMLQLPGEWRAALLRELPRLRIEALAARPAVGPLRLRAGGVTQHAAMAAYIVLAQHQQQRRAEKGTDLRIGHAQHIAYAVGPFDLAIRIGVPARVGGDDAASLAVRAEQRIAMGELRAGAVTVQGIAGLPAAFAPNEIGE